MFKIIRAHLLKEKNIVNKDEIGFTENEEVAKKYCEEHNKFNDYLFPKSLGRYHYIYEKFDYTDIEPNNQAIKVVLTKVKDRKKEDEYGFSLHQYYWVNIMTMLYVSNDNIDNNSIEFNENAIQFKMFPNKNESVEKFHERLHSEAIKIALLIWPV